MKIIVILCLNFLLAAGVIHEGKYRAAVVAYSPNLTAEEPLDRLYQNVGNYLDYIDEAGLQKCDIIVFPEDGLTGWYDVITYEDRVEMFSTPVPDPSSNINPCKSNDGLYSKAMKSFSCSALKNRIYVVVNLVERFYEESTKKTIYYNTNVVFDRDGVVVARFRKINLLNEFFFRAANESVTFKTDFGVTFGIFTCFDITFHNPALTTLADPDVTDIVFPVAWFSHLPFIQSLSIHHGYTISTGINMLSANLHDPASRNGGTAIYLAGGDIAKVYLTGSEGSRLIIADVPKVFKRKPPQPCQVINISPSSNVERVEDINGFETSTESLANYTSKAVDLNQKAIRETVCSGGKFCCNFDISLTSAQPTNYFYKMVAYHGTVELSANDRLGTRACGVVACTNDSITSCGHRLDVPPKGVTFERIEIKGVFQAQHSLDQPASLKYNLKPVGNYTFCRHQGSDEHVEVSVSTVDKQDTLLTFGIYGRVFNNDGKPVGVINIK